LPEPSNVEIKSPASDLNLQTKIVTELLEKRYKDQSNVEDYLN